MAFDIHPVEFTSEEDLLNMLNSPNNILGIEYIKSILKLKKITK